MNLFKYIIFFTAIFTTTIFAATPNQELQQYLSNTQSMQADFQQSLYGDHHQQLQSSQGNMAIQRPEKFRWEIKTPNKQLIVADGKNLWNYDVDLEQVVVENLKDKIQSTPALLLSGKSNGLLNNYNVIEQNKNHNEWFTLKPKDANSEFQLIKLNIKDKKLLEMQLIDSIGQKSIIKFSNIQLNPKLQASLFNFVPPKGIDVIQKGTDG